MKTMYSMIFVSVLAVASLRPALADTISGRVTQIKLPAEDVTLYYVEARDVFTVRMKTKSASVEGQKMYIGDGRVAIDLVAHSTKGIFLQGMEYKQGDQLKKGVTIEVRPGYKNATELKPGDVYVTLPGVLFSLPGK